MSNAPWTHAAQRREDFDAPNGLAFHLAQYPIRSDARSTDALDRADRTVDVDTVASPGWLVETLLDDPEDGYTDFVAVVDGVPLHTYMGAF